MIEKSAIFGVLVGGVFCLSATAYTERRICTQEAWIISVDVPLHCKNIGYFS